MAIYVERAQSRSHFGMTNQAKDQIRDVRCEMKHEANWIQTGKEPIDPLQNSLVVHRHVGGLPIWLFSGSHSF
jgi:hypothetical protein